METELYTGSAPPPYESAAAQDKQQEAQLSQATQQQTAWVVQAPQGGGQVYPPPPGTAGPHYVAATPFGGGGPQFPVALVVPQHPPYKAPHDFLYLAVLATILCAIANLASLMFGIPAIILGELSVSSKRKKDYPKAKLYGTLSLFFSMVTIVFTLGLAFVTTGLTLGLTYLSFRNFN